MRILLTFACAGALLWAATPAEAQLLQRPGAAPAPAVQPAPAPPVITQPATPPPTPPQPPATVQAERTEISGQAESFSAHAGAAGGEAHGHTRIVRGSTLVGMTIWAGENEKVGVVKDVLFDPMGGCIQHVVLESPIIEQQWVVLPYDVFHVTFNAQKRDEHFLVLDMPVERLRHAPHFQVNQWERIHDPQFFAQVQQFSQRIERTTARPGGEGTLGVEGRTQQSGRAQTDIRGDLRTEGAMPERQPTGDLQTPGDAGLRDEVRKDAQQRTEMQREQRQGTEPQADRPGAGDAQRRSETQRQGTESPAERPNAGDAQRRGEMQRPDRPGTGPQIDRPAGGQQGQGDRPSGQSPGGALEGQSRSPSPGNQPQTDQSQPGQPQGGQPQGGQPQTDRPQSGQSSGQPQSSNR